MAKIKKEISQTDRILAAVSYVWVLWLIGMILSGNSEFVLRHSKQGLVLFVAEILLMALAVIPFLGWLIGFVGFVGAVVVSLLGIMHAWRGEDWEIPFIGSFSSRITF